MKTLTSTLLLLLTFCSYSQLPIINWGPEISVADGSVYGNVRPRLALTGDGQPIVSFGQNNTNLLFIAKGNGSTFNTPISVLPPMMETYLASWTGADIDAFGDTVVAVFKALPYEEGKVYSVRSIDGGLTFSDTIRVDNHDSGMAWMPSMSMTAQGNPIVTYMAHDGPSLNPRYVYVSSSDGGVTYNSEIQIASLVNGEACDCCPAELVTNGTKQVLLYRNNDLNFRDIYAVYSNDNGVNFNDSENVDQLNWEVNFCPSTGPHGLFSSNNLYATFASRVSGQYRVYVSKSSANSTVTYNERIMMTEPVSVNGKQNYPRISGDDNVQVIVWSEAESNNYEVYSAISTSGFLSDLLLTKQQMNNITTGTQTNPDVVYKNGVIHVVFQDSSTGDVIYKKGSISSAGILEMKPTNDIVFPNPVSSDLTFQFKLKKTSQLEEYEVIDLTGREIKAKFVEKDNLVTVILDHSTVSGEYLLVNKSQNEKLKFIVKN